MAFDSHIVTVRRLKKYIDDVIGKKANLPNNKNTIVGNLVTLNTKVNSYESNDRKYELLATGGATNSLITLNKSISNYKEIVIDCAYNKSCFGTSITSVDLFRQYVSSNNSIAFGVSTYVSKREYSVATYKTDTQVFMQASQGFNIWGVK